MMEIVRDILAYVGEFALILVVVVSLFALNDRIRRARLAKRDRDRKLDSLERQVARLQGDTTLLRARLGEAKTIINNHADEIKQHEETLAAAAIVADLVAAKLTKLRNDHDHTQQSMLNQRDMILRLEQRQKDTDNWEDITDSQLDWLGDSVRDLQQQKEKAA